jgi:quinol monooxygenase YgiN
VDLVIEDDLAVPLCAILGVDGNGAWSEEARVEEPRIPSIHGDSSVVTLVVTLTLHPDKEQEFVDFAAALVRAVHQSEPGTLLYVLHRHPTEPHTYVWVERYRDAEALKAHTESPHMSEAASRLPNWLSRPPEVIQLSQIEPG